MLRGDFLGCGRLWENFDPVLVEARSIQKRAIDALQSAKPAERITGIQELERLRAGDKTVVIPALIGVLKDPETEVRVAAAQALGSISANLVKSGSARETVLASVTALIGCLKDPAPGVRSAAAASLGQIAAMQRPRLAWMATSPFDYKVVLDALVATLGDRDAKVRLAVIKSIAAHQWDSSPPKALAEALKDESAENRAAAILGLTNYRQGLDPWISIMLRLAERDPDPSVRERCLNISGYAFKPPAVTADVVPALTASLKSGDAKVRSRAATILGEFRADSRAAIPELLRILNEPLEPDAVPERGGDETVDPAREAAWRWAGSRWDSRGEEHPRSLDRRAAFRPEEPACVGPLCAWRIRTGCRGSRTRSHPIHRRARGASGFRARQDRAGTSSADQAVTALLPVLESKSSDELGASVAYALGKIAPGTPSADRAVAALLPVLKSKFSFAQVQALEALAKFGPKAAVAIPMICAERRPQRGGQKRRSKGVARHRRGERLLTSHRRSRLAGLPAEAKHSESKHDQLQRTGTAALLWYLSRRAGKRSARPPALSRPNCGGRGATELSRLWVGSSWCNRRRKRADLPGGAWCQRAGDEGRAASFCAGREHSDRQPELWGCQPRLLRYRVVRRCRARRELFRRAAR